jgi:hypothetical protein
LETETADVDRGVLRSRAAVGAPGPRANADPKGYPPPRPTRRYPRAKHVALQLLRALVDHALKNRVVVVIGAVLLLGAGSIAFKNLLVEAYPDVANNWVQIITQWPGRAAEEVEQQISNLDFSVDRDKAARWNINVSDVDDCHSDSGRW